MPTGNEPTRHDMLASEYFARYPRVGGGILGIGASNAIQTEYGPVNPSSVVSIYVYPDGHREAWVGDQMVERSAPDPEKERKLAAEARAEEDQRLQREAAQRAEQTAQGKKDADARKMAAAIGIPRPTTSGVESEADYIQKLTAAQQSLVQIGTPEAVQRLDVLSKLTNDAQERLTGLRAAQALTTRAGKGSRYILAPGTARPLQIETIVEGKLQRTTLGDKESDALQRAIASGVLKLDADGYPTGGADAEAGRVNLVNVGSTGSGGSIAPPRIIPSTLDKDSPTIYFDNGAVLGPNPAHVSAEEALQRKIKEGQALQEVGMVLTKRDELELQDLYAQAHEQRANQIAIQQDVRQAVLRQRERVEEANQRRQEAFEKDQRDEPYRRANLELQQRQEQRARAQGQVETLYKQAEAGQGAIRQGLEAGVAPNTAVLRMALSPLKQAQALMQQMLAEGKVTADMLPTPVAPRPYPVPEAPAGVAAQLATAFAPAAPAPVAPAPAAPAPEPALAAVGAPSPDLSLAEEVEQYAAPLPRGGLARAF